MEEQFHAVSTDKRDLESDLYQLQLLSHQRAEHAERQMYSQSRKYRSRLREQKEAHEAEVSSWRSAYQKVKGMADQAIADLKFTCQLLTSQMSQLQELRKDKLYSSETPASDDTGFKDKVKYDPDHQVPEVLHQTAGALEVQSVVPTTESGVSGQNELPVEVYFKDKILNTTIHPHNRWDNT